MTLKVCVERCRKEGKGVYAGVHGRECHCGERIDADMRAAETGPCDKPCPGGPESFCGGGDEVSKRLSVYGAVKEEQQPVPPPMAAPLAQDIANQEYIPKVPDCPKTEGGVEIESPPAPTPGPEPVPGPLPGGPGPVPGAGPRPVPGKEGEAPPRKPVVVVSPAPRGEPPSSMSIVVFGLVVMGAMLFV